MQDWNFTLVLKGPNPLEDDDLLDRLFAAGCDDASFGEIDEVGFVEFDRESETFADALLSAIRDIESVQDGPRVVRIADPDELVTAADIAERLDQSRESVRLYITGQRGPGGFPPAVSHLWSRGRIWLWPSVSDWCLQAGIAEPAEGWRHSETSIAAIINGVLASRALHPTLDPVEAKTLSAGLGDLVGVA
jgi:hypothetical protein